MRRREKYYFDVKIKIAKVLFFLNALLWVGFAIMVSLEMSRLNTAVNSVLVAFFLLAIAGMLVAAGILITKRIPWAYYFAIGISILNIPLNFAGQLGVFAFFSIIINIIILMILISSQRRYFNQA